MRIRLSLKATVLLNICVVFTFVLVVSLAVFPTAVSQAQQSDVRSQPGPSPTPLPSLAVLEPAKIGKLRRWLNFLKCDAAKKTKEQELSKTGPQFPPDYDASDFSFVALTKGAWDVVLDFELAPDSTVTVTFQVKNVAPYSETASTNSSSAVSPNIQGAGIPVAISFRLPERSGEVGPQATLISFQATTKSSGGKVPAYFRLNAFGLGGRALSASTNRPGRAIDASDATARLTSPYLKASFSNFPSSREGFGSLPAAPSAAITAVNIQYPQVKAKPGASVNYNFVSGREFGAWRADYLRDEKKPSGAHTLKLSGSDSYLQRVTPGPNPTPPPQPRFRSWEVKRVPRGQYKVMVSAWWTVTQLQQGGESAARVSSSFVNIE
jgi:hypothetical protein